MRADLKGLRKFWWRKNLHGFFTHKGKSLTDAQVRKVVEYGIAKGYETEAEFDDKEIEKLLNK